ncbi:MAG: protein kinase [Planctomycetes bacterium]|nr:protein kinase [Planctomycetota bacterium]
MTQDSRLERALLLWLDHRSAGDRSDEELVAEHPDLADVLTHLVDAGDLVDDGELLDAGDLADAGAELPSAADGRGVIGDFRILRELGRGGMGIVYEAQQLSLDRVVALKLASPGMALSMRARARMIREARTLARLDHPAIVRVVAVVDDGDVVGHAMEHIDGAPIDAEPRPLREQVELVARIADALQHVHEAGIVHRDVKPSNIMVRRDRQPVLTDFGLANDGVLPSLTVGGFAGTPYYMSPEQARGESLDGRSDVYSLGVTLYELVTGRRPFVGGSAEEVLLARLRDQAPDPRTLRPELPGDLAAILLKAIALEPTERYGSAAAFAADLRAWLGGRTVAARLPSPWARAMRWARRHQVAATLAVVVPAALVAVAVIGWRSSRQLSASLETTRAAESAERAAKQDAIDRLLRSYLEQAEARRGGGRIGQRDDALRAIEAARRIIGDSDPGLLAELRDRALAALAQPDLRVVRTWVGGSTISGADVDARGESIAWSEADGTVRVMRIETGEESWRGTGQGAAVAPVLSPDGRRLALVDANGVAVHRIGVGPSVTSLVIHGAIAAAFSADGSRLAVGMADGRRRVLGLDGGGVTELPAGAVVDWLAFSPDARYLAFRAATGVVEVVSVDSVTLRIACEAGQDAHPAWHPDGRRIAVPAGSAGIEVFDVETGVRVERIDYSGGGVRLLHGACGELLLAHSMWDHSLQLWNADLDTPILRDVWWPKWLAGRCADDGRLFLVGRSGDSVELWVADSGVELRTFASRSDERGLYIDCATSPDGRLLVVSAERGFEIRDTRTWLPRAFVPGDGGTVRFVDDATLVVNTSVGLQIWPIARVNAAYGAERIRVGPVRTTRPIAGSAGIAHFGIDPASRIAAIPTVDGACTVDLSDGREARRYGPHDDVRYTALSSDGHWIATGSWVAGIRVWDRATGSLVAQLGDGPQCQVEFSPDAAYLASTVDGGRLWRTGSWELVRGFGLSGSIAEGAFVAFAPGSDMLALAGPDGRFLLADPRTGDHLATLFEPRRGRTNALRFSTDGARLMAISVDLGGALHVFDLPALGDGLRAAGLSWKLAVDAPSAASHPVAIAIEVERGEADDPVARAAHSITAARERWESEPHGARACNELAWLLSIAPAELREPDLALELAVRAVTNAPDGVLRAGYRSTLALALCRAGRYVDALDVLADNLDAQADEALPLDLYVAALAYSGRGDRERARQTASLAARFAAANRSLSRARRDDFRLLATEIGERLAGTR